MYSGSDPHSNGRWKDDRTPLTEADRASHRAMSEGLRAITPGLPVISEEGDMEGLDMEEWQKGGPEALHWMVDPLDGTKEFPKRSGEFTVNIALISEGRPVAGVVQAPAFGRSWVGTADVAELRSPEGRRPLRVDPARREHLRLVASRDHAGPRVSTLLKTLHGAKTLSMRHPLKLCLIAEARADLCLRDGPTMEWDTGAAQAVLEVAGGGVFTLGGDPLRYGKRGRRDPHLVAVGDPDLSSQTLASDHRVEG